MEGEIRELIQFVGKNKNLLTDFSSCFPPQVILNSFITL